MEMEIPENTTPMMTGTGPYGSVEMGGMFTMLKVRKDQKAGDYKDPGWYKQPAGTQAFEWTGALQEPARFKAESTGAMPTLEKTIQKEPVKVRKPSGPMQH